MLFSLILVALIVVILFVTFSENHLNKQSNKVIDDINSEDSTVDNEGSSLVDYDALNTAVWGTFGILL